MHQIETRKCLLSCCVLFGFFRHSLRTLSLAGRMPCGWDSRGGACTRVRGTPCCRDDGAAGGSFVFCLSSVELLLFCLLSLLPRSLI